MLDSSAHLLQVTEDGDATIVRFLQPKLFNDERMEDIIRELRDLADKSGQRELRLDLGSVKYLQSSALGKLLALHRKMISAGGRMVLCNVHPAVSRVLEITRLDQLLTVEKAPADEGPHPAP
jgi:anti-sigma B factor antagonist